MSKTILIVDDEANMRIALADVLVECGYKVIKAANGKEALDKVHKENPDLILLDTCLPGIDGDEVCRQIKKVEGLNTKVIVYTGYVDADKADKARASGTDDYIVKTTDISLLLERIKNLLNRR